MQVEVSGNFKVIIPQTKMCRDLLKDIFQKECHRPKKGQAIKEMCSVLQNNRGKETVFWCPKCEAALCVEGSFKAFHTKLNF